MMIVIVLGMTVLKVKLKKEILNYLIETLTFDYH